MEYTVTNPDTSVLNVHLAFNSEDIEKAYTKAYQKASAKVKVNGFRVGKAPFPMVVKALGESVSNEAIAILLEETLREIYPKLSFHAYKPPKIDVEKYEPRQSLIAKAVYEKAPSVELGEYKNLPIEVFEPLIDDSEVDAGVEQIRESLAKYQLKEEHEKIELGDSIEISYSIFDKEKNEFSEFKDSVIRASEKDGFFGKNLLGLGFGEEVTVEKPMPASSVEGSEPVVIQLNIRINSISRIILPPLDDEFAKEYNDTFQTLQDMRDNIRQGHTLYHNQKYREHFKSELLNMVVEKSRFTIPNSLIEEEIKNEFHSFIHERKIEHITMEEYSEKYKVELSKLQLDFRELALSKIKQLLVLYSINQKEQLQVTKEDFESYVAQYAQEMNRSYDEVLSTIRKDRSESYIYERLMFDNVLNQLYNLAEIKQGGLKKINEFFARTTANHE